MTLRTARTAGLREEQSAWQEEGRLRPGDRGRRGGRSIKGLTSQEIGKSFVSGDR